MHIHACNHVAIYVYSNLHVKQLAASRVIMHSHQYNNIINARRMRTSYCSHHVCLSVCLSLFLLPCTLRLVPAYDNCARNWIYPAKSSRHSKGFQLVDSAKKLSFSGYGLFCSLLRGQVGHLYLLCTCPMCAIMRTSMPVQYHVPIFGRSMFRSIEWILLWVS